VVTLDAMSFALTTLDTGRCAGVGLGEILQRMVPGQ
jgi:hypothetical protein